MTCCTIVCLTALGLTTTFGQQAPQIAPAMPPRPEAPLHAPPPLSPPAGQFTERLQNIIQRAGAPPQAEAGPTKFSLDFAGGTPGELVAAIEKATGRPLNAIIPDELANTRLPALKMNNVDVSQLFQALAAASHKSELVKSHDGGPFGQASYNIAQTSCGFRQGAEGKISDDTIWYFYVEKPVLPLLSSSAKVCRFYSLAPYVGRGMTVDDIITASEAGWKMLGETNMPSISFHKDTKLLIAVGDPSMLETIDAVLKALGSQVGGSRGGRAGPDGRTLPPESRPERP